MHEMGIAAEILRAAETEAHRHPGARLAAIGLRLGELTGVDAEALRFSFEAIVKETSHEGINLAIENCPRKHRCLGCNAFFQVVNHEMTCPACSSVETDFASGDELELAYVELEEA